MSRLGKLSFAQKSCLGRAGLAMQRTGMIWPGARVGVAVSGGADSWALLTVLLLRQRVVPFPFEIMAIHLNPGFDPRNHRPLAPWLHEHGIAGHVELTDFGPMAHSSRNKGKSPCFVCSWHRRKRLFQLCRRYNMTHLAMGHNADDLVHTFFLNLMRNGRLEGLGPRESFFNGELTLIRPLLLLEKKTIRQAVRQWGLPVWANPCPSASTSQRAVMEQRIKDLIRDDPKMRASIYGALQPGLRQSFLSV